MQSRPIPFNAGNQHRTFKRTNDASRKSRGIMLATKFPALLRIGNDLFNLRLPMLKSKPGKRQHLWIGIIRIDRRIHHDAATRHR